MVSKQSISVLGGGNTAFSAAADLTLKGFEVTLYELPEFDESLEPIRDDHKIHLLGVAEQGVAEIHNVTSDIVEAITASDVLLVIVPAYAHRRFAEVCAPHLMDGQTIVLMPGNLGTLEWARILKESSKADNGFTAKNVTLSEVDTAPYVCRKTTPNTATIWGVVSGLGLGVFPATNTDKVKTKLESFFPGIQPYPDVMACGLSSFNPVVHPAGVLMNVGRLEYSRGDFYFYEEGVSPTVAEVIMAVDEERRSVGEILGYDLLTANEGFHLAGFGPKGDLWATIKGSRMLTQLKAPGSIKSRWLTEDIPFGLVSWSSIGEEYGVDTPIMKSLINIGSVVMGFDAWTTGRSCRELGIYEMNKSQLKNYLRIGTL